MINFTKLVNKAEAVDLIMESEYYADVKVKDLIGTDVYGMVCEDEGLVACIMVIRMGPQAYCDYLCVTTSHRWDGIATELLLKVRDDIKKHGVRVVHACVAGENGISLKLAKTLNAKIGWPFVNVSARLEDNNG